MDPHVKNRHDQLRFIQVLLAHLDQDFIIILHPSQLLPLFEILGDERAWIIRIVNLLYFRYLLLTHSIDVDGISLVPFTQVVGYVPGLTNRHIIYVDPEILEICF